MTINGISGIHPSKMESQPLEQVLPGAIQCSAQLGQHRDSGGFGTTLDFLEITPAQVGLFSEPLLREGRRCAQPIDIFPKDLAVGLSHRRTLAGTPAARSALLRAFFLLVPKSERHTLSA